MPHWSRLPAADAQRRAEDLSAIGGQRCAADPRESELLATLDRQLPAGSPLRPVITELLVMDRAENADNQLARIISKNFAGWIEQVQRLAWRLLKGRALDPATDRALKTKTNQRKDTTNPVQLLLFGGES